MKNKEALTRVLAARTALVLDEPFFGQLAPRLVLEESTRNKTAWTDGKSMGYYAPFVLSLTFKKLVGLVVHEVLHCAHGHMWRRGGRAPKRWNIACDLAINAELRSLKFELPDGALYPERYGLPDGKSPEWYYDRLPPEVGMPKPKKQPQKPQDEQEQGQQGAGEQEQDEDGGAGAGEQEQGDESDEGSEGEQGAPKGSDESGEQEQGDDAGDAGEPEDEGDEDEEGDEGAGAGEPDDESWDDVFDAPTGGTEDDPAPTESDWREAVQQAASVARGNLPGSVKRLVKEAGTSRVDYRTTMRRFFNEVSRDDYSWTRPSPRYMPRGLYMPSMRSEGMGVVAIFIDTSGSIDEVALAQARNETQVMWEDLKPRELRVGYIDTTVHRTVVFRRGEDSTITFDAEGGGGTDFRPAFDSLKDWEEQPVCVVYITDLYGTFPEQDPGVPTLWVTANEVTPVPFGEVVSLS